MLSGGNSQLSYRDRFLDTRNNTIQNYKSLPETNQVFSERTHQYVN